MEPITAITIPTTSNLDSSLVKSVVLYHVHVTFVNGTWLTICKRYSEFHAFHLNLIKEISDDKVPAPFPPKTLLPVLDSAGVMDRQNKLQKYLTAMLYSKDDKWRRSKCWIGFFNIPKDLILPEGLSAKYSLIHPNMPNATLPDMHSWPNEYSQATELVKQIRESIFERDKHAGSSSGVTASQVASNNAKKALGVLKTYAERLQDALNRSSHDKSWVQSWIDEQALGGSFSTSSAQLMGKGEIARRKDLINNLQNDIKSLEKQLDSKSGNITFASERNDLFSSNKSSRRKFGVAQETDDTRPLDNSQLLLLQSQIVSQQDNALDALSTVIKRQKQIGMAISQELEYQNQLIDDLEDEVNRTQSNLKAGDKKLNRVLKK